MGSNACANTLLPYGRESRVRQGGTDGLQQGRSLPRTAASQRALGEVNTFNASVPFSILTFPHWSVCVCVNAKWLVRFAK